VTLSSKARLAQLLAAHTNASFPADSESSEELSELHADLVEYDGHVVGLASSLLGGLKIERSHLGKDERLDAELRRLAREASEPVRSEAQAHLEYCKSVNALLGLTREAAN
jgi:hypothetical protein